MQLEDEKLDSIDFSVEMETGAGKTYVYLRTLYELQVRYGFTKFVIVVPSVAIREGVLSALRLTREHFQTLYGNLPLDAWVYDSAQISRLRQFAGSNQMQVLVINIDAFNKKDISIIGKDLEGMSGRKPIEFIQSTNPIVIIDEPQNMESDKAREALASLNPGIPAAAPRAAFDTMLHLGQAGADALDTPCENEAHSQSWKKVLSSA